MFDGNWQYFLGLPQSVAPDRFVLALALLAICVRAPAASGRPAIRFRPLYILMYIAGAYAIADAIAYKTIFQHSQILDLVDRMMIMGWLVFIIAPAAFARESDRRVFIGTLVGMGIYLGFTGIFEILGPHSLVFPRYINDPHVGIHWGRARGPFVEAAYNGLALYACILATLIALRTWKARIPRALALLALAVCGVSLLLTFQRTVWLAVGISAPLVMVTVRELRRYLIPSLLAVGVMVCVAYFSSNTVRDSLHTRATDSQTVRDRLSSNAAAETMILDRPAFGFGWGRFVALSPSYYQTSNSYVVWDERAMPVHDVYLSIAVDLGLVGLALWASILLVGIGKTIFSRRAPPSARALRITLGALFGMWLAAGATSPLGSSFQSVIIWLWAAVVVGSELQAARLPAGTSPVFQSVRRRRAPSAGLH
jgi:O-antigen ligase